MILTYQRLIYSGRNNQLSRNGRKCARGSLQDKLTSLTLAGSDFDFRSLPRPKLNLISKRCGGRKETFWLEQNVVPFCKVAARSISAHTTAIIPFNFMQK
ncbi:hypothetical protein CDAR_97171 [Caerostris darwini]|uniref:Uncharacterized protein n=1 Tax=Caerostris darwini TaxID=1538125 RepID=A0AAV4QRI2_9ARAC|nr:hypothetical protein CDAR_97171 [Caerostris darwini]